MSKPMSHSDALPPLPEPLIGVRWPKVPVYSEAQMRAYALASRRAALEEAARACEGVAAEWDAAGSYPRNNWESVPQDGCDECAAAIRALQTAAVELLCFCDRMKIGAPGVSCGDCPTRDYGATPK